MLVDTRRRRKRSTFVLDIQHIKKNIILPKVVGKNEYMSFPL